MQTRTGSPLSDPARAAAPVRAWGARILQAQVVLAPPHVVGPVNLTAGVLVADAVLFVTRTGSLARAARVSRPARAALAAACARVAGPHCKPVLPVVPAVEDPSPVEVAEARRLVAAAQHLCPDRWRAAVAAAASDLAQVDSAAFVRFAAWLDAAADLPAVDLT